MADGIRYDRDTIAARSKARSIFEEEHNVMIMLRDGDAVNTNKIMDEKTFMRVVGDLILDYEKRLNGKEFFHYKLIPDVLLRSPMNEPEVFCDIISVNIGGMWFKDMIDHSHLNKDDFKVHRVTSIIHTSKILLNNAMDEIKKSEALRERIRQIDMDSHQEKVGKSE